jgi:hypothetical protein
MGDDLALLASESRPHGRVVKVNGKKAVTKIAGFRSASEVMTPEAV